MFFLFSNIFNLILIERSHPPIPPPAKELHPGILARAICQLIFTSVEAFPELEIASLAAIRS
jgi:hypothetical protein